MRKCYEKIDLLTLLCVHAFFFHAKRLLDIVDNFLSLRIWNPM